MQKKIMFILLFLFTTHLFAQQATADEKPALKPGKITLEFVGSAIAGAALGYAGGYLGAAFGNGGWDDLAFAILGVGVGYPLGAAGGAYLVGNTKNEKSSFWAVLGGSFAGAGLGFLAISQIKSSAGLYTYLALPPLGAVIAHNLNRQYDTKPGSALLNMKDGFVYSGVPTIELRRTSAGETGFSKQFRIFSIRF